MRGTMTPTTDHDNGDDASVPTSDDPSASTASSSADDLYCPDCGYNLRGITSDRCPECGTNATAEPQRR